MKLIFAFLLLLSGEILAQNDASLLNDLLANDSSSTRILFSYPDSARQTVYLAATYPQGFTRLSQVQKTTSASFRKLASKFSKNRQKQLWDLVRYPNLVSLVVANKDLREKELEDLLKDYPKETGKAAIYFAKKHPSDLAEIEKIRLQFETEYKKVVTEFPTEIQNAFNRLLADPELFFILSEDLSSTVAIGDLYKRNPTLLKHVADSVHQKIVKESGEEFEDWKSGISKDSTVQTELKQVSKKYAEEEGEEDDVYASGSQKNVSIIIQAPPYPYWSGYPYWYAFPYWHPYPWWFHSGFYWNTNGSIIFVGMPTYHFGWWYYSRPHYRHYHNTSRYFDRHYQGHPRSGSNFNRSVRDWNRGVPSGGRPGNPGGNTGGGGRRR